jgi:CheY-like chemotaxis protein
MRILGVEDTNMGAMLLERHLVALGHEVVLARSGSEAIAVLERDPDVDLVLTDLAMPDMDGFELIEVMRAHEEWRDLPVVIASGSVDVASVKKATTLGITQYLVKPIQRAQLEKVLALAVADRKAVTVAHDKVMVRLGLDGESYGSIVDTFATLIAELVARLRAGETLDVKDLRALVEAAPIFGLDQLHGLAAKILKWGPEEASSEDLVGLRREMLMIRRSLQRRPGGATSAPGA